MGEDTGASVRSILLRNVGWIYTCDDAETIVENGYVLLSDKLIVEIGREPCPLPAADASYDLAGCVVLPGLIISTIIFTNP